VSRTTTGESSPETREPRRSPAPPSPTEAPLRTEDPLHALAGLRHRIDEVDEALVHLIAQRCGLAREAGEWKRRAGLPTLDPAREARVVRHGAARARFRGLEEEAIRRIFWCLIELSHRLQGEGSEPHGPEGGS
jgi:chorismate mutase / prephenate dehydrogenase